MIYSKRARKITTAALTLLTLSVAFGQVEPKAGTWSTWVAPPVSQLRLPPPPSAANTAAEIQLIKTLMAEGNDTTRAQIAYWDAGSPGYRWEQIAASQMLGQNVPAPLFTRGMALLSVAVYDATVAAWDSKYAYNRPRPGAMDSTISPLAAVPNSPSYPSEHAVAAGAASVVLAYLFPNVGEGYSDLAEECARSRVFAGTQYPSDIAAGLQVGRTIGAMVVAYAQADRSNTPFTGSFPPAPGVWSNANPVTPLAGTWQPWVLSSGSQFRPPAPPTADSPDFQAQLSIVKNFVRTNATNHSAWFWQPAFITPWLETVHQEIFENRLDTNPPRAARAYALATIAQHDATLACWDTKFAYLELRPSLADATIVPVFGNPGHPGFPSGHACASGASSVVLGYLFPNDSQIFSGQATDAGMSTFYAAIHTMFDVNQGLILGNAVGQQVVNRAKADGAQ
ncbi:MAG: vanadium-dependent haloperoxidase [Acidobacteriota bacterium]|nr:vanadium-dependent haloperoxidase [Acidobacteriota bacterium]